jgi:hypothetical protein
VTETVGPVEQRHTDVSLWYVLSGRREDVLIPDPGEFHGIRWWSPPELAVADPATFDPHLGRMIAKLGSL